MNRRWWIRGALGAAVVSGLAAGAGYRVWKPGYQNGQWPQDLAPTLHALGAVLLAGSLPTQENAAQAALQAWLQRLASTLVGLPPPVQAEVSDLLALLRLAPGRLVLCGDTADWASLPTADLQYRLTQMRSASLALRQQAYLALRDLSLAAYYAGPEAWPALGYPGPAQL